jgi:hypothetical protein
VSNASHCKKKRGRHTPHRIHRLSVREMRAFGLTRRHPNHKHCQIDDGRRPIEQLLLGRASAKHIAKCKSAKKRTSSLNTKTYCSGELYQTTISLRCTSGTGTSGACGSLEAAVLAPEAAG